MKRFFKINVICMYYETISETISMTLSSCCRGSERQSSDYMIYKLNLYYNVTHVSIVHLLYRSLYCPVFNCPWDGKLGNYNLPRKWDARSSQESVQKAVDARTDVPRVSTQRKDIVNYNLYLVVVITLCVWMHKHRLLYIAAWALSERQLS